MEFVMPPFIQRMNEERDQLNEKLIKLTEFRASETHSKLDDKDRGDLADQHYFMTGYLNVLNRRLETISKKANPNG
jgi:hypothetical protein